MAFFARGREFASAHGQMLLGEVLNILSFILRCILEILKKKSK